MPSTFDWLDTSENDRRRALDVIDLFALKDTRDELGIGTIRDAIADRLAPGTSTIQTRARYFLFVPWIYENLGAFGSGTNDAEAQARKAELALARDLARSEDNEGVLGIRAGEGLQRLPSSVYWAGLGVLGIRLFPGSQAQYHRAIRTVPGARTARSEDGELEPRTPSWHPHLPTAPPEFPAEADFALRREDAEYLADRFWHRAPDSWITHLIDSGELWEGAEFPWEHPAAPAARPKLRASLEHGRCFSELMHGAALLYNLLLAEKKPSEERIEEYRERIEQWSALVEIRMRALASWDRPAFWSEVYDINARVPRSSRTFVEDWVQLVLSASRANDLRDNPFARRLIEERERRLKGPRARLRYREYLENWNGAAGTARLGFRWRTVQTLVADLLTGAGLEPQRIPDASPEPAR